MSELLGESDLKRKNIVKSIIVNYADEDRECDGERKKRNRLSQGLERKERR